MNTGLALVIITGISAFVVWLALVNWRTVAYGLLLFLPFAGIPIVVAYPDVGIPSLLKDFLFVGPLYLGFGASLTMRRHQRFPGAPLALLGCLSAVVVLQMFNPSLPNFLVGLIGAKIWLFYIPLYFVGLCLVESAEDVRSLLRFIAYVGVLPIAIGIVQAIAIYYFGRADLVYGM